MDTWVSAISSVILVGVTVWYAYLTRRLAISAKDSAASAERTAEIAAQALAASVAGLDVGFVIYPNTRSPETGQGSAIGVALHCQGASVFVHGVRLVELWRLDHGDSENSFATVVASDRELVLDTEGTFNFEGTDLPTRLHRDESVHFDARPQILLEITEVAQIEVAVSYSLSRNGDVFVRRASYDYFED